MSATWSQTGEHWWEEVRPQISVVLLFLVLLLALSLQNRVAEPDIWWHLRTGQWILEEQRIPYWDPFSFTMTNQPWTAHSWLAEVAMYLLYRYVGAFSLLLLRSLLQVATFALLLKMSWDRWQNLGGNLALLSIAFLASAKYWLARPNSASLALSLIVLYIWYRYKWQGRDLLWLLPILFVLWVNLHAGYMYGLALLGALWISEPLAGRWWPDPAPLERKQWLRLGIFSLSCIPAVVINPYGVRQLLYPLGYFVGNMSSLTGYIGEWASPDFHELSNLLFALLILLLVAAMAWRRTGMGPAETMAVVLVTGLSLNSGRVSGIAAPLLVWSISGVVGQGRTPRPSPIRRGAWPQPTRATRWIWYGGTLLLVLLLLVGIGLEFGTWGRQSGFLGEEAYPRQAVDWLEGLPTSRILNSYNWGGYLIWRLYPQHLVFIDGRVDLYTQGPALADFVQVYRVGPQWAEVLNHYQVDTVLCEMDGPLATLLTASTDWDPVYLDEMAAVFRRVP